MGQQARALRVHSRLLVLAALIALPGRAFASANDDKALATELFAKGVKRMEDGKCDQPKITDEAACGEARELFAHAYEIYPAGLGALRNLAYVERGLGRYASAARHFRELQQKAPQDPNPKRHVWAEFATKELETLEPLVPRVTIVVPVAGEGTTVTIDDKPLPKGAWGTAIEIDPGSHKVHAEANGAEPFDAEITLSEKDTKTVEVTLAAKAIAPEPAPKAPLPMPPEKKEERPSRALPLVVAGVGVVTIAAGLVLGYRAISKKSDACGEGKLCEPSGLDDARSAARWSNVVTGVGAIVAATGVTWFLLTPDKREGGSARIAPLVGPGFAGAALSGAFR